MARYSLKQSGPMSCGAACIAVALHELGIANFQSNTSTENSIYPQIWRSAGDVSAPALIDKFLNGQSGIRAWIMEDLKRTAALMIGSRGALFKPWCEYTGELWRNSAWRYPRGLLEKDLNSDARVMLVSIIASSPSLMHYVLARRDGADYYIMNPDGPSDDKQNDIFTNYINSYNPMKIGVTSYIYTGISVWIAPAATPWSF
jgi:hypothetical protein